MFQLRAFDEMVDVDGTWKLLASTAVKRMRHDDHGFLERRLGRGAVAVATVGLPSTDFFLFLHFLSEK